MSQYECKKAIETFQELPLHQYNTGFVRSKIGRAYFELADYSQVMAFNVTLYVITECNFFSHKAVGLIILICFTVLFGIPIAVGVEINRKY